MSVELGGPWWLWCLVFVAVTWAVVMAATHIAVNAIQELGRQAEEKALAKAEAEFLAAVGESSESGTVTPLRPKDRP